MGRLVRVLRDRESLILTTTGLMGWDYTNPKVSSYEQLSDLALFFKCPNKDVGQLFHRMAFNLVFANHDDHLKNQSFIVIKEEQSYCNPGGI